MDASETQAPEAQTESPEIQAPGRPAPAPAEPEKKGGGILLPILYALLLITGIFTIIMAAASAFFYFQGSLFPNQRAYAPVAQSATVTAQPGQTALGPRVAVASSAIRQSEGDAPAGAAADPKAGVVPASSNSTPKHPASTSGEQIVVPAPSFPAAPSGSQTV